MDDRGRLHLGQASIPALDGGTSVGFVLRPGLEPGIKRMQLRLTSRAERLEGMVEL
jgi:hypothetical protein